ncbi:MAG: PD-(D/E)XK nuclease family protein [Comamonadaceae bacterium]|nr:PD-(D/E)XK nuclease family protein [Comamonadaceae bacterium]
MTAIAATAHPASAPPENALWRTCLTRVHEHLRDCAAHPARSVVLLPFAQLLPLAQSQWAACFPDSFAPHFETTRSWARRLSPFAPGPSDIAFDTARDTLTAHALLEGAGLAALHERLAAPLLETVLALAPLAAAAPPALRPDWAELARQATPASGDGWLAHEAAVARLAIAWAAASDYATDVLFSARTLETTDALVALQGVQDDALTDSLLDFFTPAKALALPLASPAAPGQCFVHTARDAEDEAQRAAACVLHHLAAGRAPVALAANDRAIARRVHALLGGRVTVRDETGWKLSTTQAAATLMAALHAAARRASSDDVLAWLKLAPAASAWAAADVPLLERHLRRAAISAWQGATPMAHALAQPDAPSRPPPGVAERLQSLVSAIDTARARLDAPRPLPEWLAALRTLLQAAGQWPALLHDAAGQRVLEALHLHEDTAQDSLAELPAAHRRLALPEFTAWVGNVLEAASFIPPPPPEAQLVILPLAQVLARPFAALVLPGCDEVRLPAAPEPPGLWTPAQRQHLRLPTRDSLQAAQQAAWRQALGMPQVDVLWRQSDSSGEPLLPSPLVQALPSAPPAPDNRPARAIAAAAVPRPAPNSSALPVTRLSASSYGDLRTCPYRFFALHQCQLREAGELDAEVSKRDFGNWLHDTLHAFHQALQAAPTTDRALRSARLDAAAQAAAEALALDEGEFLPFSAQWPALRDSYLDWLDAHEASGATYVAGETPAQVTLGAVTLEGRLDRIDHLPGGTPLLIDYKTEHPNRTRERIAEASEDTQLPFYAALLPDDSLSAAYLNLGERHPVQAWPHEQITALRDALVAGITQDMQAIASGHPLPALGEGAACDWCAARGLCRRDFWSAEPPAAPA